MLRAIGTNKKGNPVVLLGVDEENITRLRDDKPIKVNLKTFAGDVQTDLPDIDVCIFITIRKPSIY